MSKRKPLMFTLPSTRRIKRANKKQKTTDPVVVKKAALSEKLAIPKCMICLSKLSIPLVQCISNGGRCGQSFHEDCINEWLANTMRDGYNGSCPHCTREFTPACNRALEDLLEMQGTACINSVHGCNEFLPRKDMQLHHTLCSYRQMECAASQYKCEWRGLESKREAHETDCMYILFGQQAVDTIKHITTAGDVTVARIEHSIDKLDVLKRRTERRLQQLSQLKNTLSIDGYTKHYVVPLKTREHPLNVQNIVLKLSIEFDEITRDVKFSVHGVASTRYPVAVCTIAFLLLQNNYIVGENSRIESFILCDTQPFEVLNTQLSVDAPSDVPLDFKLVTKLFY